MSDETTTQADEAEHIPSETEMELAAHLRNLGVGRINSAHTLAKMLAPLLEAHKAATKKAATKKVKAE